MPDTTSPLVAYYGDDFTGSVDVLLQLQRFGWRGRLFLGLPSDDELRAGAAGCEVVGIAGVARSLAPLELVNEVRPAIKALRALGPRVLQYKACSTADSSPTVGSLGQVIDLFGEIMPDSGTVPVLFAQPDFGRYTAFGHHFAAEGGQVHRLDRQPTMANHPSTPMRESHLATHLAQQTRSAIGGITLDQYSDDAALTEKLRDTTDAATVLDAVHDEHLRLVGSALAALAQHRMLATIGSGGLSTALGHGFPLANRAAATTALRSAGLSPTPVLAVSGSRSPQTARQITAAVDAGWQRWSLDPDPSADAALVLQVDEALAAGRSVIIDTDAFSPEAVPPVATVTERLAAVVKHALRASVTRRVIVCGGDTSSHLLTALGASSLEIAANPFGNVVVCRVASAHEWLSGTEMLLKGGQVGPVDLFEVIRNL